MLGKHKVLVFLMVCLFCLIMKRKMCINESHKVTDGFVYKAILVVAKREYAILLRVNHTVKRILSASTPLIQL